MLDVPWAVYPMIAVAIAVIVGFPRVNKVIPAPLVAIVALTAFTIVAAVNVPNVGDEGELPDSFRPGCSPTSPSTSTPWRSSPRTPWRWHWSASLNPC